ncbi:MAG: hypothetical protein AB1505_17875 [Candidatus Latescibacterota bacterium]
MSLLDAQERKFRPTGKQRLAASHGQAAPPRARKRPNETLAAKDSHFVVTTFRIRRGHYEWLKRQAVERALKQGNKPDASAIVRELLDRATK